MKHYWIKDTPEVKMLTGSDNFIGTLKPRCDPNGNILTFLGVEKCKNCSVPMVNKRDTRHKFCTSECFREYQARKR